MRVFFFSLQQDSFWKAKNQTVAEVSPWASDFDWLSALDHYRCLLVIDEML